jgi:hypothetical protein
MSLSNFYFREIILPTRNLIKNLITSSVCRALFYCSLLTRFLKSWLTVRRVCINYFTDQIKKLLQTRNQKMSHGGGGGRGGGQKKKSQ